MGLYREHVLPRIDNRTLDRPDIRDLRERVCAGLVGDVVEVGFGSGLNVAHYPSTVDRVLAVEPSRLARRLAAPRVHASTPPVVFAGNDGQHLPFGDASADSALLTWTLCAVPEPAAVARELLRVLVPGGRVAYLEHGASPDPAVSRWQRRLGGVNQLVGGCRLDGRAPALLADAGFVLEQSREYYLQHTPRWTGFVYEGTARKAD